MNKPFISIAMAALLAGTVAVRAFADQETQTLEGGVNTIHIEAPAAEAASDKGAFTSNHPLLSHTLLSPLRLSTALVGAPLGFVGGMASGMGGAVDKTSQATFGNVKTESLDPVSNTSLTFVKAPFLMTAGTVGTWMAAPVGMTYGSVKGTFTGAAKGYMYPDKL